MNVATLVPTRSRGRGRPTTLRDDLVADLRDLHARIRPVWPSARWRRDPVGFAREVLAIELTPEQVEIVESIRENRNTTVRSGHKCGKTTAIAVAALWFYDSFDDARVLSTAVKASQVDDIIWKEIKRLYRRARDKRGIDLGGKMNDTARFGFKAPDGREIIGLTARSGEGLAGFSGANMLVLADEASGISDSFFEVLGTSLAGAGGVVRKCYISNPTRTIGEFFKSHQPNSEFHRIHISAEAIAERYRDNPIPGLASLAWIEERRREWGEESAAYKIRVKGEFAADADLKVLSTDELAESMARWEWIDDEGDLQLGIDPAGEGMKGDETVFAMRRGMRIVSLVPMRGLSAAAIAAHAVGMLDEHRRGGEMPTVAVDVEGGIGTDIRDALRAHLDKRPTDFDFVEVRGSKVLWGSPEYHCVRDALWGIARKWVIAGGALPEDDKLREEFNAPTLKYDDANRFRATPKDDLRKLLKRSPDRADAVCLAVYRDPRGPKDNSDEVAAANEAAAASATPAMSLATRQDASDGDLAGVPLDPLEALRVWSGR